MDLALAQDWKALFALAADARAARRHEEEAELFYEALDIEKEKVKRHETQEREQAKKIEEVAATTEQLAAFNQHLDDYDTQTVHALMENGEALDRLRESIRRMQDNAVVLPDGRRVFKTADGQRVFDEHGGEVPNSIIDPHMIDDRHTGWEMIKAGRAAEAKLEGERHDLFQFQAKVDEAHSHVSKGNITKKELDDLDADLQASAPPAVRDKLSKDGQRSIESSTTQKAQEFVTQALMSNKLDRPVRPVPAPM